MPAEIRVSGPVFDGRAEAAASRATAEIRQELADKGSNLARLFLASSVRAPRTGRAEASIVQTSVSTTFQTGKYTLPVFVDRQEIVVTTDLASYGPWLEGTGSRNFTTRFKGYHSFRLAAQSLQSIAPMVAESVLTKYIPEMNG